MINLATRIYNLLDTYELNDTNTTPETIENDLINTPYEIIKYLVGMIENQEGRQA